MANADMSPTGRPLNVERAAISLVFAVRGIEMQAHEDTMLMSYVLDAGRFGHSLDALAPRYFSHAAVDYNDVIGTGKAADRKPRDLVKLVERA